MTPRRTVDVAVVGGGPAGAAAAYWLASAGVEVVLFERKHYPRDKTCGDGLTPRSLRQLDDMGLAGALLGAHRYEGLRAIAWGRALELTWPDVPGLPRHGYVIARRELDALVAEAAEKAGATLRQDAEVIGPLARDGADGDAGPEPALQPEPARQPDGELGFGPQDRQGQAALRRAGGVVVRDRATGRVEELAARFVVVADGANSRVGRALGARRDRRMPQGMALRGYFRSPRHDDPFIESRLDLRLEEGGPVVPGYGWVFPMGDGRVNVGVGLLTTADRWKGVNTSRLMERFVELVGPSWGFSWADACGAPTGGRLPMGLSVGPVVGPDVLLAGDAAGAVNPFNGEGIAYGYETGRLAAHAVLDALQGDEGALPAYAEALRHRYADYFKVGRAFVKLVSHPAAMTWCVRTGMRSKPFMGGLLRIMANLLRPSGGLPERALGLLEAVARVAPEP
jgi:geranylgeranyl reductase family protein